MIKLSDDTTSTISIVSGAADTCTHPAILNCLISFVSLFPAPRYARIESTQLEDPRQEWKSIQEHMLREYLTSAQDVLVAKKEIYDVKQQRLLLAEDEYNLLNALAASRSSRKCTIWLKEHTEWIY